MKINTKIILIDPDGKPYKDYDGITETTEEKIKEAMENAPGLTLGKVIGKSLTTVKTTDPWKAFKLTNEFLKNEQVDLKPEDIVYIKDLIKEAEWITYVIGQVIDILDGNAPEEKEEVRKEEAQEIVE